MAKQSNLNQSIESIESSGKGKHKGQCICLQDISVGVHLNPQLIPLMMIKSEQTMPDNC